MSSQGELASDLLLEALPQLLSAGPPPPPHVIPRFFNAVLLWRPATGTTLQATSTVETQMAKLRALSALAVASAGQAVGSAIAQCMECMKERDRALKLQALQTASVIAQASHPDSLAFFLPGVTSALVNVIAGDFKHGDAVRAAAVDALVSYLCLAFPSSSPPPAPASPMRVRRTTEWNASVAAQLSSRLVRCFAPHADAKPKLRQALALNAAKLVRAVPAVGSSDPLFSSLLDALLFCYDDPLVDIASAVQEALKSLQLDAGRLGEVLRKKLSALPLLARSTSTDDAAKIVSFRLALSLVRTTATQPGALELVLDLHLTDISTSLLPLYTVDERASALPEPEPTGLLYPRKEYVGFHDPKLALQAREFVQTLGRLGPALTLVDNFVSYFSSQSTRSAALLIIADLVAGAGTRLLPQVRAQLRQELLVGDMWLSDGQRDLLPPACYTMEALGALVSVTESEEVKREILPAFLYRLLEQLGGGRAAAAYAHVTMARLARATGESNASALLGSNADYLIDELALRLRSLDAYPSVPSVLLALFKHCPSLSFAMLDDTLDLLLRALDAHHRHPATAAQLLNVLQALIRLLSGSIKARPTPPAPELPQPAEMEPPERKETTPEEVREFFLKVAEEKAQRMKGVDLDAQQTRPLADTEEELQPTREETALLKCVEKTRHFVTRPEVAVAQASLAVQLAALPSLWRMQGAVLPTIHSLWQPLVTRIGAADGAPDVLQGVLHTVASLIRGAPDFLLSKFNGELLPALSSLLRKYQSSDPISAQSELSPAFRLQLAALVCMNDALRALPAAPHVKPAYDQIGDLCAPYLAAHTPAALQEAAMELFKCIVTADPDALWLQLVTWASVPLPPPPPGCKPIIIPLSATRHPAGENARILLKIIQQNEATPS